MRKGLISSDMGNPQHFERAETSEVGMEGQPGFQIHKGFRLLTVVR